MNEKEAGFAQKKCRMTSSEYNNNNKLSFSFQQAGHILSLIFCPINSERIIKKQSKNFVSRPDPKNKFLRNVRFAWF